MRVSSTVGDCEGGEVVAVRVIMEISFIRARGQDDGSGFRRGEHSLGTADHFCINLPGYIGHKRRKCYIYSTSGHPGWITAKRLTKMNIPDAEGRMCATQLPRRKIRK